MQIFCLSLMFGLAKMTTTKLCLNAKAVWEWGWLSSQPSVSVFMVFAYCMFSDMIRLNGI